jgi:hypothetical protein
MKSNEDVNVRLYTFLDLITNGGRCAVLRINYFISKKEA